MLLSSRRMWGVNNEKIQVIYEEVDAKDFPDITFAKLQSDHFRHSLHLLQIGPPHIHVYGRKY